MNADIRGEHDAIVHYLMHAWTVAEVYGPQIEAIAKDEMQHLKWLAHSVVHMRGIPDFSPRQAESANDLKAALIQSIAAEDAAIAQYEDHIRQIPDKRVQDLLRRIVVDEKDHRRQFEEMSVRAEDQARDNPPTSTPELAQNLQSLLAYEYGQVLEFLFRYFVEQHDTIIGMDDEDRAIEAMKHLGWIAESLVTLGSTPSWLTSGHQNGSAQESHDAFKAYERVAEWAQKVSPAMLPTLHRIIAHEQYHNLAIHSRLLTVGSLKESGKDSLQLDVSQERQSQERKD